jgi:hypothetical protein
MTYKEVTILQFQQIHAATIHHKDNIYEIGIEILDTFEQLPRSESSLMKVKEFDKRLSKYAFLNEEVPSDEWVKEFTLQDITYKVAQTPDKWNVGQFVSMANLTKDPDKIIDNVHLIVAVMCTTYEKDVFDRARLFQSELSISIAYPLALFFCALMLKLPESMMRYLKERAYPTGSA